MLGSSIDLCLIRREERPNKSGFLRAVFLSLRALRNTRFLSNIRPLSAQSAHFISMTDLSGVLCWEKPSGTSKISPTLPNCTFFRPLAGRELDPKILKQDFVGLGTSRLECIVAGCPGEVEKEEGETMTQECHPVGCLLMRDRRPADSVLGWRNGTTRVSATA